MLAAVRFPGCDDVEAVVCLHCGEVEPSIGLAVRRLP